MVCPVQNTSRSPVGWRVVNQLEGGEGRPVMRNTGHGEKQIFILNETENHWRVLSQGRHDLCFTKTSVPTLRVIAKNAGT